MSVNRLRWFGRFMGREKLEAVRTVLETNAEGSRGRGRSKKGGGM